MIYNYLVLLSLLSQKWIIKIKPENTEINNNDGNGWIPAIVTNTFSVNALTYESFNISLISSSQPNVSSSEVIMSKI